MKVRHPSRPSKHGHNKHACGVCHANKRHGPRFTDHERALRRAWEAAF